MDFHTYFIFPSLLLCKFKMRGFGTILDMVLCASSATLTRLISITNSDRWQEENRAEEGKSGRQLRRLFSVYTSQVKRSSSVTRFDSNTNIQGAK